MGNNGLDVAKNIQFKPSLMFLLAIPLIAIASGCEDLAAADEGFYNGQVSMHINLNGQASGYF